MKIRVFASHITFQNPENGYTVLEAEWADTEHSPEPEEDLGLLAPEDESLTLVGLMAGLSEGMTIEAEGSVIEHPVYGPQFKVSSFREIPPEGERAIERYLASGAIKGIGPKMAKRIVAHFGEDSFHIIDSEPERLAEVKGISQRKAREIAEDNAKKRGMREALVFLMGYGISNTIGMKVYKAFGDGIYAVMRENPYALAEKVEGIGFQKADEIAHQAGIRRDSAFRVRGGVQFILGKALAQGHTYLPVEKLLQETAELLELKEEAVGEELENLVVEKKLILKGEAAFAPQAYYAELACARLLTDIRNAYEHGDEANAAESCKDTGKNGVQLDERQAEAVGLSMNSGVFILTGGPGTGKTTTINAILARCEEEGLDFLLAAPTGRAAKRITETTGYEARTIHRLLEINASPELSEREFTFQRNAENPLEADVIIIDEMSMVDVFLFHALLKAVPPGTHLILVGDVDQLPSVGAGQVLRDLLDSGAFSSVRLKQIHRQKEGSEIVRNAHRINEGQMPGLDNQSNDFFFLPRDRVEVIYKHMVELIRDKLPPYVNADMLELQVLTPMRKGPLGAEKLNQILQQSLNPPKRGLAEYETESGALFRVGDKVMQIRNNYDLEWRVLGKHDIVIDYGCGVFNGDIGRIRSINSFLKSLTVEFDDERIVEYPYSGLSELELAYCVTIHKSQGSEYPAVILPLLSGPPLLMTRNLLYTAVTRAKKCVVLLGRQEQIRAMVENRSENTRYTGLKERLAEMKDEKTAR